MADNFSALQGRRLVGDGVDFGGYICYIIISTLRPRVLMILLGRI